MRADRDNCWILPLKGSRKTLGQDAAEDIRLRESKSGVPCPNDAIARDDSLLWAGKGISLYCLSLRESRGAVSVTSLKMEKLLFSQATMGVGIS